jgi:hypothetical protein
MKYITLARGLIFGILISGPIFGASSSTTAKTESFTDAGLKISQIIDSKIRRYKVVKKDMNGISSEGGQLTAYLKGKEIKKLVSVVFGEMGKSATSYYLRDGKLVYVKDVEYEYDRPIYEKGMKVKNQKTSLFEIPCDDRDSISIQKENEVPRSSAEKIQQFKKDVSELSNLIFESE